MISSADVFLLLANYTNRPTSNSICEIKTSRQTFDKERKKERKKETNEQTNREAHKQINKQTNRTLLKEKYFVMYN